MTARTPGPWKAERYTNGKMTLLASVKSDSAIVVADFVPNGNIGADAEFIALACNSHDRLTAENAALRGALKAAYMIAMDGDHPNDHGPVYRDYISRLVVHLRAALAQGESK